MAIRTQNRTCRRPLKQSPVHPQVDHVEPEPERVHLHDPEDDSAKAEKEEDEEPPPEDEEDFVVDDVEREDADGVDVALLAAGAKAVPFAGGDSEREENSGDKSDLTNVRTFYKSLCDFTSNLTCDSVPVSARQRM
jgi:hypothetical protein